MTDTKQEFQLAVVGGGPGGYAAAFHAAEMGMKVALIDADPQLGGVCLNRGCIPSKSLLHVAKLINETRESEQWGVKFSKPKIDLDTLRSWKNDVVGKLTGGLDGLAKRRKVQVFQARATFEDSHTLKLQYTSKSDKGKVEFLTCDNIILASGSVPAMPGMFKIDDPRVLDSTGALKLDKIPKSLLVIGGGYIGLEMGTVYAALGAKVTVVELTDGLLPGADRDLVRPLQARLEEQFDKILLSTKVEKIEAMKDGIQATLQGQGEKSQETFDRVLVSVGRWPNSTNLGLENTRVELDEKGFVKIDSQQKTADPAIYAIGDVAGEPMLAHKASREAVVAVEVIAGKKAEFDNVAIPAVVFTDPEVAWCGLTENEAKAQKIDISVSRFPWAASGRAQTLGRAEGLTKLIFDPETERVLGMGIVGPGAGELIAEGTLAVEMAAVAHDISDTIHAHPTLSETMMESAEAFFGHATHLYRPKR